MSQVLGDGILAFFGVPAVHEDDLQRAVRFCRGSIAARLNDYAGADLEALERWVEIGRERAG